MGITNTKHIHKYMRVQLRFATVWRCALPDCNHFMPPHMEEMVIGKSSICWGCGHKFVMDDDAMKDDMPNCINCRPITGENYSIEEIGQFIVPDKR